MLKKGRYLKEFPTPHVPRHFDLQQFADEADHFQPATKPTPARRHLSSEDQLYIWCLALTRGIAGKVSPAQAKGQGSRTEQDYELLINDANAVAQLNSVSDIDAISVDSLKAIVKRFRRLAPPFQSSI